MNHNEQVGKYIKGRREQLRLTQQDMANELRTRGIETSITALSRLEAGGSLRLLQRPDSLEAIARVLKVGKQRLLKEAGLLAVNEVPGGEEQEYFIELLNSLDPARREIALDLLQTLVDKQQTGT